MATERHPKELKILFFTEMWERFGFYLIIGILWQYMTDSEKGGLGWSGGTADAILGSYLALVYFTPFIGGLLADRVLGYRRTIVIGAILMMIGYFGLSLAGEEFFYISLGVIILGNGAFKPNISSMVGNLYAPQSSLKEAGYNIFYMGINVGAFICNIVAAIVRNSYEDGFYITPEWKLTGWQAAFATAGFGMLLGLVIFAWNFGRLAKAEPRQEGQPRESLMPFWLQCIGPALILGAVGWFIPSIYEEYTEEKFPMTPDVPAFILACIPVIVFYFNIWRNVSDRGERGRVAALLVIFSVVIIFWAIFNLNSTALTEFIKDDTDRIPGTLVRPLTDTLKPLAEDAPASYFTNSGADTERPARSTFIVVDEKEYKKRQESNTLIDKTKDDHVYLYVTPEIFAKVYANTTSATPILKEPGKVPKLANTELFQSINPAFVVLFTPLVVGFWSLLRRAGKEPSTAAKIGVGLVLTAGGPLIMYAATLASHDGANKVSAWWLFGTFSMLTLGELCLSPMGLALVNKTAPARIQAFMMGGWFLSTSLGGKLSGIFAQVRKEMDPEAFWIFLGCCALAFAGIIFVLLPWLNREMRGES